MDKKILLISSVIGGLLVAFPFVAILIYILLPFIISALTGTQSPCDVSGPSSAIGSSLSQLCSTSRAFLGISSMLGIILMPFVAVLAAALPSFDIFTSQRPGGEKAKWLAVTWLVPAIGPFLYYWFVKRAEN